jgi:hypothetical protein
MSRPHPGTVSLQWTTSKPTGSLGHWIGPKWSGLFRFFARGPLWGLRCRQASIKLIGATADRKRRPKQPAVDRIESLLFGNSLRNQKAAFYSLMIRTHN